MYHGIANMGLQREIHRWQFLIQRENQLIPGSRRQSVSLPVPSQQPLLLPNQEFLLDLEMFWKSIVLSIHYRAYLSHSLTAPTIIPILLRMVISTPSALSDFLRSQDAAFQLGMEQYRQARPLVRLPPLTQWSPRMRFSHL